eukprot:TRINITY_DN3133_c1_g2_i1.p1 TRINITY_DN3133_c1_g2~~TRINITY_DN3133_c1_g2_i1.p1  ORF type:complete len:230 (+),score=50.65 TRINITY_DN3133_c1_g2_i1:74-691(+)
MSGQIQIDALAYIDPPLTKALREQIDQMIEEELATFPEGDYLQNLPLPESRVSSMVQDELQRVAQGRPPLPLDRSRYEVIPPAGSEDGDMAAWSKAISNAQAQYQQQVTRHTNLELLNDYGKDAWLSSNEETRSVSNQVEQQLEATKRKIEEVNTFRKHKQRKIARVLKESELEWMELCRKNQRIQTETEKLERDISSLRGFDVA